VVDPGGQLDDLTLRATDVERGDDVEDADPFAVSLPGHSRLGPRLGRILAEPRTRAHPDATRFTSALNRLRSMVIPAPAGVSA
jgi:hypothetical protein